MFEYPFDLCKVRLQTQVLDQTARFSGPIDCLTKTWKYEGFRGLYRVRMYPLCDGGAIRVLKDYMRPLFFAVVGFTSTNSGSDDREFVPLSIIQGITEPHPLDEPYTSPSGSEPLASDFGRLRCWCRYEFFPVSSFLSSENFPRKRPEAHGRFIVTALLLFFLQNSH